MRGEGMRGEESEVRSQKGGDKTGGVRGEESDGRR